MLHRHQKAPRRDGSAARNERAGVPKPSSGTRRSTMKTMRQGMQAAARVIELKLFSPGQTYTERSLRRLAAALDRGQTADRERENFPGGDFFWFDNHCRTEREKERERSDERPTYAGRLLRALASRASLHQSLVTYRVPFLPAWNLLLRGTLLLSLVQDGGMAATFSRAGASRYACNNELLSFNPAPWGGKEGGSLNRWIFFSTSMDTTTTRSRPRGFLTFAEQDAVDRSVLSREIRLRPSCIWS